MKQIHKNTIYAILTATALLSLGVMIGWWFARPVANDSNSGGGMQTEAKPLYWYDPMYPQQRFDQPGKSPFMDMELVPKYADAGGAAAGVKIDAAITQNLGVRLSKVVRISMSSQLQASGIIVLNERDVANLQSRSSGFVERVWPLAPGDIVQAGQPLVEFLVPDWAAAQHEFLALRSTKDQELLAAARDRLRALGMPEETISALEKSSVVQTRYTVKAPISGVIESLDVRAGMTVMAGQPLARINGLSTVWLEVAVPEAYAGVVKIGNAVTVNLAGGQASLTGRVSSVVPTLQDVSRSIRVRVELPNRDGRLKPGMTAQVKLQNESAKTALSVPTEAVIRTGKRALVMVADGKGHFLPVEVEIGSEIGNNMIISSGLIEGQEIVASGQFLIDSEAKLSGIDFSASLDKPDVAALTLHEADATIDEMEKGELTLSHGPFKSLSMPGMTMRFPLAKVALAKGLKVGDRVHVGVRQSAEGLVIERIEKIGGAK